MIPALLCTVYSSSDMMLGFLQFALEHICSAHLSGLTPALHVFCSYRSLHAPICYQYTLNFHPRFHCQPPWQRVLGRISDIGGKIPTSSFLHDSPAVLGGMLNDLECGVIQHL